MQLGIYQQLRTGLGTVFGPQFLRYAVVGISSNLILYLAYLAFTASGVGHKLAMSVLYVSGVVATFIANRSWSFEHTGAAHKAFIRYFAAYVFGYFLNLGLLLFGVDYLGFPHQAVQALGVVLVAVSLFVMHRYWVFAPPNRRDTL